MHLLLLFFSQVTGPRHPFRKDPDLDYDVDSDEEWEEVCVNLVVVTFDRITLANISLLRRNRVKAYQIVIKMMKRKN